MRIDLAAPAIVTASRSLDPISQQRGIGTEPAPIPVRHPDARSNDSSAPLRESSEQETEKAVESLNQIIKEHNITLDFRRDDETDTMVLRLIDQNTGETVHQIPSEVTLHLSAVFGKLQGCVVDHEC